MNTVGGHRDDGQANIFGSHEMCSKYYHGRRTVYAETKRDSNTIHRGERAPSVARRSIVSGLVLLNRGKGGHTKHTAYVMTMPWCPARPYSLIQLWW